MIHLASILDFNHIVEFASALPAQQPHPSDLGLVKPSTGFALLPAIFGLIAVIQVSNFHWYARKNNEPTEGWGINSDSSAFSYRWRQFFGVQILCVIVGASVFLAGPDLIFFPLGLK